MNKAFGTEGKIENFLAKDLDETIFDRDGIVIKVKDGIMCIEADTEGLLSEGLRFARLLLATWSKEHGIKLSVDFKNKWKLNSTGGKDISLEMNDKIKLSDRLIITHNVSISGKARIVKQEMYDSASFKNHSTEFEKALKYPVLEKALIHFSEEVVDDDRPLYGVYKALEGITKSLGKSGREKLADLADQPFRFVDDVMSTTQTVRHNNTDASRKLSDDECKQRAKILIDAFSKSLG